MLSSDDEDSMLMSGSKQSFYKDKQKLDNPSKKLLTIETENLQDSDVEKEVPEQELKKAKSRIKKFNQTSEVQTPLKDEKEGKVPKTPPPKNN